MGKVKKKTKKKIAPKYLPSPLETLRYLKACSLAVDWVRSRRKSWEWLWNHCDAVMWLFWLAEALYMKDSLSEAAVVRVSKAFYGNYDPTCDQLRKAMPYPVLHRALVKLWMRKKRATT